MSEHLDHLAGIYSEQYWHLFERLDQTLDPRGPDLLHEVAREYLTTGSTILDAGCRDAAHLIRLVQAHDASGVGVDPLAWHVGRAKAAVEAAGLDSQIRIVQGVRQELPFPDASFDFIWCRDVLEVVDELHPAITEAARVLKTDGHMLVYTDFSTSLLEPDEAEMVNLPLGNVPASMIQSNVEDAFYKAGLAIERKDVIGTEWREYAEERMQPASRDLLRLARLRRQRDAIIEEYGEEVYATAQASLHWTVYQFLGKVEPTLYVLRPRPG